MKKAKQSLVNRKCAENIRRQINNLQIKKKERKKYRKESEKNLKTLQQYQKKIKKAIQ